MKPNACLMPKLARRSEAENYRSLKDRGRAGVMLASSSGRMSERRIHLTFPADHAPQPQSCSRDEVRSASAQLGSEPELEQRPCEALLQILEEDRGFISVAAPHYGRQIDESRAHQIGCKLLYSRVIAVFGVHSSSLLTAPAPSTTSVEKWFGGRSEVRR